MNMSFLEYVLNKKRQEIQSVATILMNIFNYPHITTEQRYKAHDVTEVFWKDDSPLIPWLHTHNINIAPGSIPPFAQGGSGRAYFLHKQNRVVKMSTNRVEANVADMTKNQPDLPTPIIDVTYLDKGIYAILQYYVNTDLPGEIKKAADYLTMIVDDYPEMQGYPESRQEQKSICVDILKKYRGSLTLVPYMLMILEALIRLYQATGFKHTDAGPTNIAFHQDKIVIPDLGPNEDGDYDTLSSLANIAQNREKLGLKKRTTI